MDLVATPLRLGYGRPWTAAGSWIGAEQPACKAGERRWLNGTAPIYVDPV